MKLSQFRKLLREEIRKVVNELDSIPPAGYNPIGIGFILSIVGKTSDGKQFSGPYKLAPDYKVKLKLIGEDDGATVPDVQFMSLFRNQLIGKDLGRVEIQINVPLGSVNEMGKSLMQLINKTFSSNQVRTDRGVLNNAGEVKNLLNQVVSSKWSQLSDDAINNPKAQRMMYGMGASIDRVAATRA